MSNQDYTHISTRTEREVLVITVTTKRLEGETLSDNLRDELLASIDQAGIYNVVVDMKNVTYATSRPLGVIAGFHRIVRKEHGGKMALCNLSRLVREAMSVLRFIEAGESGQLVSPSPEEAGPEQPKGKVLFEIVEDDEASAVDALMGL